MHERTGEHARAARAAFWIGFRLLFLEEIGRGTGGMSRVERLLERHGGECVERAYLCVPRAYGLIFRSREPAAGLEVARQAAAIGERFADLNLTSLARMIEGQANVALGQSQAGLAKSTGIPAATIRVYESSGLLRPASRSSGN